MVNVTTLVNISTVSSRDWTNAALHFDDTLNAFISLFHIATLDNWGSTMYQVIAGVDYDHAPVDWYNTPRGLYFVAFIFIGALFIMNMFVGLIIENFQSAKAHMDGVGLLTDDQKLWVETQRMMLNFRPQRLKVAGKWKIQQAFAHFAEETYFELTSATVVFLNIIVISMESKGQSVAFTEALDVLNIVFTSLFLLEAMIKIIAYDRRYFLDNWNRFDFFIVVLGLFDLATNGSTLPINVGLLRILRVFRIARILVLVRKARDIRVLLETLWYSIPSLANIGAFMFLILFVFTVLGVQLFSNVQRDGVGLTEHMNFEGFGTAFLFLIQVTTLDNWGSTMTSLENTKDCGPASNADGLDHCGTKLAPLYFVPFILISGYVMVNLFCAIILDNFDTTMELDKSDLKVTDLKRFADAWALFDPDATMLMETKNFALLLAALKPPLGVERKRDRKMLLDIAGEYVIPEHGGTIHFVETLIPMARKVLGVQFTHEEIRDHEENWKVQFPDLNYLRVLRYRQKRVTVDQYLAATYIGSACRRRIARRMVNEMRQRKKEELEQWYNDHEVPLQDRTGLARIEKEERDRQREIALNKQKINDVVHRGRLLSAGGLGGTDEDGTEGRGVSRSSGLEGLGDTSPIGAPVVEVTPVEALPPQLARGASKRQDSQRRESVRKRSSVSGLTGFTQLWAKHAENL